jgi:hypothetical protein
VTTLDYSAVANLRAIQITVSQAKPFQSAVSSPVVPWSTALTMEILQLSRSTAPTKSSLHRLPYNWLISEIVSVITSRLAPRRKHRPVLYSNRFRGNAFFLRRRCLVTAAYTSLLRICCLAANVVSLFVWRSLSSNGSTRYSIVIYYVVSTDLPIIIIYPTQHEAPIQYSMIQIDFTYFSTY